MVNTDISIMFVAAIVEDHAVTIRDAACIATTNVTSAAATAAASAVSAATYAVKIGESSP